jgi:hypothetical protein
MGFFKASTKSLHVNENLKPQTDEIFMYLLEQAIRGGVLVYYGAVPFDLIRPYDTNYNPEAHLAGKAAIQKVMEAWQAGHFAHSWVYPRGDHFILADDYITYAAAKKGKPDFLPCWILGLPTATGVKDVQGPIATEDVRSLLGFT